MTRSSSLKVTTTWYIKTIPILISNILWAGEGVESEGGRREKENLKTDTGLIKPEVELYMFQ
eukprot:1066739-Amorphochlora_amoeboformis.AAC.2